MKTLPLLCSLSLLAAGAAAEPLPDVPSGSIQRLAQFPSRHVDARNVDVWLPQGYTRDQRYDVIYMQDGQMLFDARVTWNKQSWDIASTLARLQHEPDVAAAIVVGIWNNGKYRHAEYFPDKFLPHIPAPARAAFVSKALEGGPRADAYLRFITQELKPYIDAHFATAPDPSHTHIMGSSMGGLISLYAICEYPEVFGSAAALSTHWIGTFEPNATFPLAAFNYLQSHLPPPATHRIYMDRGTVGLDAAYGVAQPVVDQLLRDRGYSDENFLSRQFDGATHGELDWARRLEIPLRFLLRD